MQRALLPIYAIVLMDALGTTLVLPLLPFYAEHFGATPLAATSLFSIYSLAQLVAGVPMGRLSDRYGRKPILLISLLGTIASFVLMASAASLWLLFVARALDGATAGNLTVAQAYVVDKTKPHERTRAFSLISSCYGIGFTLGPALAAALIRFGPTTPIWLAAGLATVAAVLTATLLPGGAPPRPPEARAAAKGVLSLIAAPLVLILVFACALAMFASGFALFAERRITYDGKLFGPREVGLASAYFGLMSLVIQIGLSPWLVRKLAERRLAIVGFAALGIDYLLMTVTRTAPLLVVAATVGSLGMAVVRPSLMTLLSQRVEPAQRGSAIGAAQSMVAAANILAPAITGLFISSGRLTQWTIFCAVLCLVACLATARLLDEPKRA